MQENIVKALTGGDTVIARGHYKASEEFVPTHTLFLRTNHKPRILGTDEGIWRRMILLPFVQDFSGDAKDRDLGAKLQTGLAGILNWILEGVRLYAEHGLNPLEKVKAATEEWRESSDEVGQFLDEGTYPEKEVPPASVWATKKELHNAYLRWKGTPRGAIGFAVFNGRIEARGYEARNTNRGLVWVGICIKPECQPLLWDFE